ncbi:MAG: bifunctional class I SAM-dependent methyltransferase/glycosyltransferase family 2 protein [Nitrospirota bacterium]|nr:bifunctional class I SAM-dependent methyltransferase/glycosyltransferase family 2 protein [Nitrospirota bacterium]
MNFFNAIAEEREKRRKGDYYHKELEQYLRFVVPPKASVLELGCGTGETLAALNPSRGLGIDISLRMVEIAREKFPHLSFETGDLESLEIGEKFDYVVIDGTIGNVDDIQIAFKELHKVCKPETRIVIVYYNYLWEPALKFAEAAGLRTRHLLQHWLPLEDIANLLFLNDFEVVKKGYRCLMPVPIPVVSGFFNKILANMPFFWRLSLNEIIIARPMAERKAPEEVTCSVIIPCRNERGNIEQAVLRTPDMGKHTEIIFVEGNSSDGTLEECKRVKAVNPDRDITVLVQDGKGKGDAVRKGFAHAKNDVLMILDADLTVPPEDLPKFFNAISSGKGEFINGSRLVYQMEKEAMRFLNLLGNKFFSMAFTYLLEQRIRDTLCGTKVLWKEDYEKIIAGRQYFGDFDPFGDFDLLFGAAKLNLKIVEVPIRYRERTYGRTQISRFRHGVLLFKMTFFALKKIKFI